MKRLPTLPALNKKLWKIVSEYVRRKDADDAGFVRCFTCGNSKHWKQMDCGHYVAKSISLALRFDERNLRVQCDACNRFRHGNLTQFALGLERQHGPGFLEQLDADRRKVTKYSRGDYQDMIEAWKKRLKGLDGEILGARQ